MRMLNGNVNLGFPIRGMHFGQYYASTPSVTAAAAQFPVCQIFNPASNIYALLVYQVLAKGSAAMSARLVSQTAHRTTVFNTIVGMSGLSNSGLPVNRIYTDSLAALGTPFALFDLGTSLADVIKPTPALYLEPGQGLELQGITAASTLTVTFVWAEL